MKINHLRWDGGSTIVIIHFFLIQALFFQGVGGREAVWQRRYFCIVGPSLYMLETPESRNYEQYFRFGHGQITIIFLILFADKIYTSYSL